MGTSLRVFIIHDDDSIKGLSVAKFERLRRRDLKESLPQYAGKRIRYALVVLEVEQRKPVAINRIQYNFLYFDSEGRIDASEREKAARLALEMLPPLPPVEPQPEQVIVARHKFAKRRYDDHYKWTPTPEIEEAIVKAIFG